MRLTVVPGNLIERVLIKFNLAPTPLADTMIALLLARSVMTATKMEIFEALKDGPLSANEIAKHCNTDLHATEKLLFALTGAKYLKARNGEYSLAPVARRWLLKDSPHSIRDATLHRYLDASLMEHADEFLRTGKPTDFHQKLSPEEWEIYQRGQRSHALYSSGEVARRAPVPTNATQMLDIGGAHGFYSVALCRKYPNLKSTILDLPDAVAQSAPILAQENMGERMVHRAGNALTDDLGENLYDVVLLANLVHHFSEAQNRNLMQRIARALKPNGVVIILEIIRAKSPEAAGQIGALTDFYFAITSASGTWSFEEMANWQKDVNLRVLKPIKLQMSPGYGMQCARKI